MDKDRNIKLVAARAKVSIATVSRTINGLDCVKPETAKRVWKAIEELQYHPNVYARTLGSGRSRILGLIISDIGNPFFPDLVKSFETLALQNGYEVFLTNTNYDAHRMAECARRMLERRAEGVAIMTSEMEKHTLTELVRRRVPIVSLDQAGVEGMRSNISVHYGHGIAKALEYLYGLGHRSFGFLAGPANLGSARTRRTAFLQGLQKLSLTVEPEFLQSDSHKIDGGEAAAERMLAGRGLPTAILASNDLMATGALRALRRHGLRVPEDVSLVGFDDIELSQLTEPPLTTVRLSRSELAEKAFRALHRILQGESEEGEEYFVETELLVRGSTGVPRSAQNAKGGE